ncbi:DEAD/DEAH box helicase family protein [Mycoplasma nasistruthionis]|uniref:DEAD/DEAH box helicase n=1 Tax=Mycoplasma nasistruthionis TaxID=353852 RepID=A0A4Y6I6J3_9MOLU|nr:DEAD/DEAH box helicase family protein [Mycoplasma nasistruthionis]QCZ36711.1 DEAD/DEAH box helicase [Mycoplasma nasistruthionis]QDF65002.1 DEAD/DEAH box helicase [Mycoplasma nasistruthionis]
MEQRFLYQDLEVLHNVDKTEQLPEIIKQGVSNKLVLREYQIQAFRHFVTYFESEHLRKNKKIENLFHMATGSGKTVIMAGLILYLYTKGYRKFLFFVNQTNVLEKTIDNFTNSLSQKYLFNENIEYLGEKIKIDKVENFSNNLEKNTIEIVFTTTQKLHLNLLESKENTITWNDFEDNQIVFISDESHHVNSSTKKGKIDPDEASWENSVKAAFDRNKDNILLEFTATCDLKNANVLQKYRDKIIFDYPLYKFRECGYTKDFQNFATDTDLWTRALMALVMSEYRRFLFSDLKLNKKPVVMLKSQKISESETFYEHFFKKIKELTTDELLELENSEIPTLKSAIQYFKAKDETLETLKHSIQDSFTTNNSIIINGSTDNNKEKQLLVNSLEDLDNPIRLVFSVDMLNEGWDVLNLYDIVRLYDTRQGGKSTVAPYTIKEAQLIGRGARYYPFIIEDDSEEENIFKRKFDYDITNQYRILETMYFHSKNDSSYISELKRALIETGLQSSDTVELEYKLKDNFKETPLYNHGVIFRNKRVPKTRDEIQGIEGSFKTKTYYYKVENNISGQTIGLFDDNETKNSSLKEKTQIFRFHIKDKTLPTDHMEIGLNTLLGTSEYFEALKFSFLKQKYPNLKSKVEFFTSDNYLGQCSIHITHFDKITGRDLFKAVKKAFTDIANHVGSIKQKYIGTSEFTPIELKKVIKDKKIRLKEIRANDGQGVSQSQSKNIEYYLNLSEEDWYVYNDNYGTVEEKAFIKHFKDYLEPKLKDKDLKYYVVRNERIAELSIYSFEDGERFEPDYLLLITKKDYKGSKLLQTYIEPKGEHLIEKDKWKEDFLGKIEFNASVDEGYKENTKIFGLPFFNKETTIPEFDKAFDAMIKNI